MFIHQHQVFERPRLEEESVSLLQRHGRGKLGLFIVVTQVSDLIKVTAGKGSRVTSAQYTEQANLDQPKGRVVSETYWFPNSDATNRKPVFRTHMAVATGIVSKYFSLISVT